MSADAAEGPEVGTVRWTDLEEVSTFLIELDSQGWSPLGVSRHRQLGSADGFVKASCFGRCDIAL